MLLCYRTFTESSVCADKAGALGVCESRRPVRGACLCWTEAATQFARRLRLATRCV